MKNLATAIATSGHLIEQNKQGLSVEDVFSTYLYTGNATTDSGIVNGINLSEEGGMVWIKRRTIALDHLLFDTERGATKFLHSQQNAAEQTQTESLKAFNTNGFDVGSHIYVNNNADDYVSWTFRKAPRFFDVVKYSGDINTTQIINHNLTIPPAMIIIKATNAATNWTTYTLFNATQCSEMYLDLTAAAYTANYTSQAIASEPIDTSFTVQLGANTNGYEYIAYLFADDPLGPSGDGSDGLIACGSYVGDGGAGTTEINLGWEPQYVLIKNSTSADHWYMFDTMRGWTDYSTGTNPNLRANESGAEELRYPPTITATGFRTTVSTNNNASGNTYIYMAIRRPMRTPESSDEVFAIDTGTSSEPAYISNFPVDFGIDRYYTQSDNQDISARLIQGRRLKANETDDEVAYTNYMFDYMNGWRTTASSNYISWMWKRATGFFDVVAYTGDGIAGRTVDHNLGVVPEMMWVKNRTQSGDNWPVYHKDIGNTKHVRLDTTEAEITATDRWNNTSPTDTQFTLGTRVDVNWSGAHDYIAFLFATLAGISKVGSYTGNGTSQTLDCGFAAGAKFVLIKRTDSTGDWYMWDSVRGIVAGNDPHLSLNTTAAEVTSDDSIDPDSTGFIVNQVAATNINVSSATYIFYAIA